VHISARKRYLSLLSRSAFFAQRTLSTLSAATAATAARLS